MLVTGFGLIGLSVAFIAVPLLGEIIEAVKEKEKCKDSTNLNDKAAAVFSISQALGAIIGPILGGFLNDKVGYRYTCDIVGFCSLTYAIIYCIINFVP